MNLEARARVPSQKRLELYQEARSRGPPLYGEVSGSAASAVGAGGAGGGGSADTIYIKTQVFRLLRYYSPAPRNIARSDWATQNITHNMTSSIIQPYGAHSP